MLSDCFRNRTPLSSTGFAGEGRALLIEDGAALVRALVETARFQACSGPERGHDPMRRCPR